MLEPVPVKILAVDDLPENLLVLEACLKIPGYDLHTATSGAEALALTQEHDFAVILMDVQMPHLDGFETARLLRKEERTRTTPIIFVTAIYRSEENEQRGYGVGAVDYLFKPINIDILRAKVGVFAELYRKNIELQRQAELIQQAAIKQRENEFLRDALKARDDFLSIISHELKTPITPLSLQMQMFMKLMDEGSFGEVAPEKLQRMLKTSYSQVERLSRLINDLLEVSRLTNGKLNLQREPMDLAESVHSVLSSFGEEIKRSGCPLVVQATPGVTGNWDRFRIEQVLINLLTNSLKYSEGKPIEISVSKGDGYARLRVKDQGIGIPPEDHQRIFLRFERAVSSDHYGGIGLGLYITNQIVQLHSGRIEIESQPGQGAAFTVLLPLK